MQLGALHVIHIAKGRPGSAELAQKVSAWASQALHLDSCQRWLWAYVASTAIPKGLVCDGVDHYEGEEAYRFLLKVSTGLASQVLGETDIFGQLKEAWRKQSSAELDWVMQRLFEDTKDIRSRYLQNLGGASYGSLVRMMLKQSPGPRLLVGAGALAQSVAPYLLDQELWLVNRSTESQAALYESLCARALEQGITPRIRMISASGEAQAWKGAASVVICIPMDAAADALRVACRQGKAGPVIHLGGLREAAGVWKNLPEFSALDDLFDLQKTQGDVRMTQVSRALRACDEKAKLRSMGPSVTLPHGWEDLAVFA